MSLPLRRWLEAGFPRHPADNPWLDALRTLAVALVLLRHGQRLMLAEVDPDSFGAADFFMLNGWVGVDLFFVLSGYLIGANLLRARASGSTMRVPTYLLRRARRILPAYIAVLAATVFGLFPGYVVSEENLGWRVIYHLLFLQDVLPSDINVVFWSLGVEAKFYLAAPLLMMLLTMPKTRVGIGILLGVLVLSGTGLRSALYASLPEQIGYPTFWAAFRSPVYACLEPLLLGVGVAIFNHHSRALPPWLAKGLLALTLGLAVIWFSSSNFMGSIEFWDASVQPLLIAVLFAGAVLAASALGKVRLWGEPMFRVGARLSYALYLVHFPLLPLAQVVSQISGGSVVVFWGVYIGMSLSVATFVHLAIEAPFLRKRAPQAPSKDAVSP